MRGASLLAAACLAVVAPLAPATAFAQAVEAAPTAQLQIAQGPHYAGMAIEMHVVAEGFEEEPNPDVTFEAPPGTRLEFVQARPQVSSMMQIINGRISQSRTVRHAFVYHFTAPAPGRYSVGPFTVTQDGRTAVTRAASLEVVSVPEAGGQKLRVVLPEGKIFIGQRVPVTVEWWTEEGVAERLFDQTLRVPLFLDSTSFQFLDEQKEPSRVSINVDLPGGVVEFPAEVKKAIGDNRNWVVRSFTRTMVPVAAGRFELGPPELFVEEATAFRRDIFGSRVPSRARRVKVSGEPMTFEVAPVPSEGRPGSFAGAIGQGFSMDVAADRTVLQTGDPVKLTFTIHGDGSLDAASLPPLDRAGLSPKQFRLPDGEVAGVPDATGGKRFEVTVRVLDANVREIPPIEYSWFDPVAGRFASTRSQPIALSVRGATIVGAGDVVSAAPAEQQEKKEQQEPRQDAARPGAARTPAFTLTGADLSIETDVGRLTASAPSLLGSALVAWTGYAGGLLALAAGLFVRRQRRIDPVKAALARDLRALRSEVARASAPRDVAYALRRMALLRGDRRARLPGDRRALADGLDDVLARLDEAAYAPGGASAPVPAELRSRALAVADAIVEEVR